MDVRRLTDVLMNPRFCNDSGREVGFDRLVDGGWSKADSRADMDRCLPLASLVLSSSANSPSTAAPFCSIANELR